MAKDNSTQPRQYWGKQYTNLPVLDLTLVQRESYQKFLEDGIRDLISEVSPIADFTGKNWELAFGDYYFGRPRLTPQVALEKGLTFDMGQWLSIPFVLGGAFIMFYSYRKQKRSLEQ